MTKQSTRKEVGRQSRGSVTGTQKLNKDEFHAISESVSGTALNQDMLSNRNMLSIGLDFDGLRPEGKVSPAPPSTRPYASSSAPGSTKGVTKTGKGAAKQGAKGTGRGRGGGRVKNIALLEKNGITDEEKFHLCRTMQGALQDKITDMTGLFNKLRRCKHASKQMQAPSPSLNKLVKNVVPNVGISSIHSGSSSGSSSSSSSNRSNCDCDCFYYDCSCPNVSGGNHTTPTTTATTTTATTNNKTTSNHNN